MYIPDLHFCDYFEGSGRYKYGYKNLLAVGWLDHMNITKTAERDELGRYPPPGQPAPIPQGRMATGFFSKLRHLFDTRHEFMYYCGHHDCAYCDEWSDQGQAFIPGDGVVYAAPLGILHYIDIHGYCPPEEFQDVVLAYPGELNGPEYMAKLKDIDERLYWMLWKDDWQAYKENGKIRSERQRRFPWSAEWDAIEAREEAERIARMTEEQKAYEERSKIRLPKDQLVAALKKEFSKNFFK